MCATSETAARGGVGMDVDVNAVPQREPGMAPFEIMTSESQERMLAIITPENLDALLTLCAKWEVRATVVGHVVEPSRDANGEAVGMLRIRDGFDGEILAEVPAKSLADEAPLYDRPRARPSTLDAVLDDEPTFDDESSANDDLLDLLLDPAWVYRQYDSQLFLNTVVGPGRDAALLRLAGPVCHHPHGASRSPLTRTLAGARWILASVPRSAWLRVWRTWPASGRPRRPW